VIILTTIYVIILNLAYYFFIFSIVMSNTLKTHRINCISIKSLLGRIMGILSDAYYFLPTTTIYLIKTILLNNYKQLKVIRKNIIIFHLTALLLSV